MAASTDARARSKLHSDDGGIDVDEWAGGIPEEMAQIPQLRVGKRWFTSLWLVPFALVLLVVSIGVAQQLRTYGWMQRFIERFPATSGRYVPVVNSGYPWWLRWEHFFNIIFIMFIIRAGLQILADHPRLSLRAGSTPGKEWLRLRGPVPPERMDPSKPYEVWTAKNDSVALPKHLGIPGLRHSIGLARWWHFAFDLLFVINGVIFYVLLFTSSQWQRLIPQSWSVFPSALSAAIQYASLDFPQNLGYFQFDALQQLTYFITIFVAAPLAIATGLLQGPSIAGRLGTAKGLLNRQVVRTVHFGVLMWMVFFIAIHTVMVWITGFVGNLNHITLGGNTTSLLGVWIYLVAMVLIVALWVWATPFTIRHPRVVQRVGAALVGWLGGLMEWTDPRAEYTEKDISPWLWPNGRVPTSDEFTALAANDFHDYRLEISGLCDRPQTMSMDEIKALPKHEQITQHYCIQGWSGIAKWGGVRMTDLLTHVGASPEVRYVVFYSFGEGADGGTYYDAHEIDTIRHELSMLAYEMNGDTLGVTHGAPLRVRNEAELGFKMVKWVKRIELVTAFDHIGEGHGGYNEDHEFFGYRAPI